MKRQGRHPWLGAAFGAAGALLATTAMAKSPPPRFNNDFHPANYTLVFRDEFSGNQLDRNEWCTRLVYPNGPTPQVPDPECQQFGGGTLDAFGDEQQRYVDYNTLGETMHVVNNGVLSLRATRTRNDPYVAFESALIRTKKTFRPGPGLSYYITSRMKLPSVIGSWPAFWMAPTWDEEGRIFWPPEIDIMEGGLNGVKDTANMVHIGAKPPQGQPPQYTFAVPEFDQEWGNLIASRSLRDTWIEFGALWAEDNVCFYVDGQKVLCESYKWVNNAGVLAPGATVLLNLTVGGGWAGSHGVDAAGFPITFDIDRVRVYRSRTARGGN